MMVTREERVRKAYLGNGRNIRGCSAYAEKVMEESLRDDARRDITTEAVLKNDKRVYGFIEAKEKGVLAGLDEVLYFYARHNVKAKALKKDGDRLKGGDRIAEIEARERDFLKVERTGLNVLQRMSGIATETKKFAAIAGRYEVKIAGTRKTLLNYMDKKAILLGGGLPHRIGLYDAILIKDNHLSALREEGIKNEIETAIERAYASSYKKEATFIEIEVSNLEDAVRAARKFREMLLEDAKKPNRVMIPAGSSHDLEETGLFPCIIMMDNMKPAMIRKTVDGLKKKGLYDYVLLEVSGGITEKNLGSYARSGIDVISMGAITHSVRALDIHQKIIGRKK